MSIFTFGMVQWRFQKIAADFYPQLLKSRLLQPVYLLCIVTQLFEMLACLLPCSGVTEKWHFSRSIYAGPLKWRENNRAKMTSRSRKMLPVRVLKRNKTSQNHTSLLQELDCCRFEPKRRFWSAFQFQGPVISECTCVCMCVIVLTMRAEHAGVGLWVAVCFLAKISLHRPTCKTTFAHLIQSQAISQSFRVFITFRSMRDTTFFHFSKLFFCTKSPFPLPWWSKYLLLENLQVAGGQLRNPPA